MRHIIPTLCVSMFGFFAAPAAQAAVLAEFTHDYGLGQYDPSGSDALGTDYVQVSDGSTSRFSDSFDFTDVKFDSIDALVLTLKFSGSGPSFFPGELWSLRVFGSNSVATVDDFFVPLADIFSPQSVFVTSLTDFLSGGDAFATSVANKAFDFGFSEFSRGATRSSSTARS